MKFEKIFEPIRIGKVLIKNRIAMAPMANVGLADKDGILSQRAIDYYQERAYGGVGLIITGVFKVEEKVEPRFLWPLISCPASAALGELTESVHYFESKIFVQLTAGHGRVLPQSALDGGAMPLAPSEIPAFWRPSVTAKALTTEEVEELVSAFSYAAAIVKGAGADGIELHGHEGYLMDQFTTALWNRRTDKYGGPLIEDRLRFPIEILNAIKKSAGQDFPVVYRFGLKHYMKDNWVGALKGEDYVEAGRDVEEGLQMAKLLERAGFDALHVDAGCYDSWYWPHPPAYQPHGCMVELAERVKRTVKIPVITVGRLYKPELVERLISEGRSDMVALGRALLADPHWVKKVQEGRVKEICPCIGCFDGCEGRLVRGLPVSCTTNPTTGREKIYAILPTRKSKRVLVAGGGVAGMEAARVAAIKGDAVTLFEKTDRLGGHLIASSVPDFKEDIKRLVEWYELQLERLKVEVKLATEVIPELVKEKKPEKVIIATGSTPIIPNILGIDKPIAATCIDLLLGKKRAGENVIVVGGGLIGCETGLWLALKGRKVTIIEMLSEMFPGEYPAKRQMLLDLLVFNKVKLMVNTKLKEIGNVWVNVRYDNATESTIRCDTVALAIGLEPRRELYNSLSGEIDELYAVGDCREPRKILNAIWEGYNIGLC